MYEYEAIFSNIKCLKSITLFHCWKLLEKNQKTVIIKRKFPKLRLLQPIISKLLLGVFGENCGINS